VENLSSGWEEGFAKLVDFKEKFGHCNVPQNYKDAPGLGVWVANYRRWGKIGMISPDRISRLTEIGLSWDPWQDLWMQSYSELVEFYKANGHSNVPQGKPGESTKLAKWVLLQRRTRKGVSGITLSADRIELLNRLNFEWDRHDAVWEKSFSALLEYKQKNSHCNVKPNHPGCRPLYAWVLKVRRHKKEGKLSEDKVSRLESIGFVWESGV
jgi:hypothetical protein